MPPAETPVTVVTRDTRYIYWALLVLIIVLTALVRMRLLESLLSATRVNMPIWGNSSFREFPHSRSHTT